MSREVHVRICEGVGVRFPCATRLRNHLDFLRRFYFGKLCPPSLALDWQIKRLIEVDARVSFHARL
jgi:hypothetical protein